MLASEFLDLHKGKLVRLNREYVIKDSYTRLMWERWEGIITGCRSEFIAVKTTKKSQESTAIDQCLWPMDMLILIETSLDVIFPINKHLCPRCKKDECKEMDMIECLLKEKDNDR